MPNVRELLARLNPQTIKFDTGRGGVAELTNQDIAGALAFVPPGLGREVLIACWWPDGGRLDRRKLLSYVLTAVRTEWERQGAVLQDARTELAIAEVCAGWHGVTTPEQRRELERARAKWAEVKETVWPKETPNMLPALTSAVLTEIAGRHLCEACDGRGEHLTDELLVRCTACHGHGTVPASERSRAKAIGRSQESYRRHWVGVYGWLLRLLTDAEAGAAKDLSAALERDVA